MIKEYLEETVANWELLGHPALLERFVLRNGKPFAPRKRIGRRGTPRHCFSNAAQYVLRRGGSYVEGFSMQADLPIPIHHAWVTIEGTDAMDPTLPAAEHEYFGVSFDAELMRRELLRNKRYGLLDIGIGFNTKLMFELDPELAHILETIRAKRKVANG